MELRFSEEIVVLLLSEDTGALDRFSDRSMNYVLAGATLMDLALENRIDNDQHRLVVIDPTLLDDPLLDPTLADIVAHREIGSLQDWLERIAKRGDTLRTATLTRLVRRGILQSAEEGLLFLSSAVTQMRRYPSADAEAEQEVRLRIMRLLFSDDIPGPRDIVIVCLVHACRLFETLLTRRELNEVEPRIKDLIRMDLIGQALFEVIRNNTGDNDASFRWSDAATAGAIPKAKGLPIVGNALDLSRDLLGFLVRQYREHGPVFKLKLFNQDLCILAGPQANEFVARYGSLYLSSHFAWSGFNNELGATWSVVSMDGPEHLKMRRALAYGYSRVIYEKHIGKAIDILRDQIDAWQVGAVLPGYETLQRMVIEQIGQISAGFSPGRYYEDLCAFLDAIMTTTVIGTRPMFLYRRHLNRVGRRIGELCTEVLDAHLDRTGSDHERSLISDVLELHRQDPVSLPECNLKSLVLAPFIAGLDTVAGTCSFALYILLKNPELLARVQAEADELFASGNPDASALRAANLVQRVGLETLRLYPVAPGFMRQVANSFVFNGYRLSSGERVMVAPTVTHFLPEYFPEPERFDIDRYLPERAEHKRKFVYAPFGLGAHRCLGLGMAGPQIALTTATLVRHLDLALDPPDYQLRIKSTPTPRPKKDFKLRVVQRR